MLRTRACRRRTVVVQAGGDEHGGHCGWAPGECCRLGRLLWGTCGALLAVRRRSRRACSAGARSAVLAHTCSARGSGSSGERGCWQERRVRGWEGSPAPSPRTRTPRGCAAARRAGRAAAAAPLPAPAPHATRDGGGCPLTLPLSAAVTHALHLHAADTHSRSSTQRLSRLRPPLPLLQSGIDSVGHAVERRASKRAPQRQQQEAQV
jgi:hypothetical protein